MTRRPAGFQVIEFMVRQLEKYFSIFFLRALMGILISIRRAIKIENLYNKKGTELSIFKNFGRPIDSPKIETLNTTLMFVIESVNSALPDNDFSCLISSQRHIIYIWISDARGSQKTPMPSGPYLVHAYG